MENALVADEATGWAADWCTDEAAGVGTGATTEVTAGATTGATAEVTTGATAGATAEATAGAGKSPCTLYSAPWGIFHKLKSASGRTTSICRGSSWEAKEKSAHIIISESSGEGL